MTEDEAKTKWCPFVRVVMGSGVVVSTRGTDTRTENPSKYKLSVRCIASECMMWRWDLENYEFSETDNTFHPTRGYCGLAK